MWETVAHYFDRYPSQRKVAKYIIDNGVRVKNNTIMLDKLRISSAELARAVGVDKRVVSATIKTIMLEPKLESIFSKLQPSCNLKDVAPEMGWDVLEIILSDPALPGVLGNIATTIGKANISIRQAIGEDPTFSSGLLFIITETTIPGYVIDEIKKIRGIESITIR